MASRFWGAARVCGLALIVVAVLGLTPTASASGSGDDSSGKVRVRPSAATRAAQKQVDVLTASREEITQRIAALDADYAAQQAEVDRANEEVATADEAVKEAKARVALAQNEVEIAQRGVVEYAVESYVHPPAKLSMHVLSMSDTQDAAFLHDVLEIVTTERHKVVEVLAVKKRIAAMEQNLADKAASEAEAKMAEAQRKLSDLAAIRSEQLQLASDMDERLDHALSEAAALAEVDENVARELAEQELALYRSVKTESEANTDTPDATSSVVPVTVPVSPAKPTGTTTTPPNTSGATNGGTSTPPSSSPPTTRKPSPTTTAKPSPTTTAKPPATPTGVVTWADIVYVGGIPVHKSIESKVRGLLNAATAAGISLSGGGYRDSAGQIATRRANCGPTYYDIYEKPSGQCRPPTAIPGRSMHERGLAMDLKSSGSLITSRSNRAFVWLSNNAARFGFYNLPSEPWHWSTNGH